MANGQTWAEALNINPENLNEWSSQVPQGKPLLVWCLEQGHVDLQEYLLWASEHFGLPILSSSFFASGGLDPETFKTRLTAGSWSAWAFPIEEWDGITYVACVEPPSEDRSDDVRYVLADPRAMSEAWEAHSGASADASTDMPVGVTLETKIFKLDIDDQNIMKANTHLSSAQPGKPPVREETVLGNIGGDQQTVAKGVLQLDDNLTTVTKFASIGKPEAPAKPAVPVKPATTAKPTVSATPPVPTAAAQKSAPKAAIPPVPVEAPVAKPHVTAAPVVTATIPKVTPVKPTTPEFTGTNYIDADTLQDGAPDLSQKTTLIRFSNPVEKLNLPANESAALTKAFAHINKVYKHTLVLRVADTIAKLYKTDDSLKPNPEAHLNLDQPSCLRIVLKTGLPYHGYLVDTPLHREFFSALGGGELPDCVTAVPLKVNGRLWGVLMAMGTEELQNLETLGMVEGTAVQLLTALGPTWARGAA